MRPSRTLPRMAGRSRGAATMVRSGGFLSLAFVLMVNAGGCRAMNSDSAKSTAGQSQPTTINQNPNAAKTDFHKEVSHEESFNVHVELARVFEAQGNFEAAVAEYQKAVDIGALKGSSHVNAKLGPAPRALAERRMAAAFDRMGRFGQAEVHYRKAMALAPKDAKVWNDVGYSYYLQDRYVDAVRAFKTAETIDPNNSRVQTNLGLTLAAQGKTSDALAALSRAGGPAVGRANLGFILAALGKTTEARSQYQTALALQPELAPARRAIEQLDAQARLASATAVATTVAPPAAAPPPPLASVSKPPITLRESVPMALPTLPPTIAAQVPARAPQVLPVTERKADTTAIPTRNAPAPTRPPIPATLPSPISMERTSGALPTLPSVLESPSQSRVATTMAQPTSVVYRDPMVSRTSATVVSPAATPPAPLFEAARSRVTDSRAPTRTAFHKPADVVGGGPSADIAAGDTIDRGRDALHQPDPADSLVSGRLVPSLRSKDTRPRHSSL
jgi:Flp pilus assembly protein TadD